MSPHELVRAIAEDQFAEAVIAGWSLATERFGHAEMLASAFAHALSDYWCRQVVGSSGAAAADICLERLRGLIPWAEQPAAERSVAELLTSGTSSGETVGLKLLAALPRPWSAGFSRQYVSLARAALSNGTDQSAGIWGESLSLAARAIAPASFPAATQPWEMARRDRSGWQSARLQRDADRFLELVRARESLYQELFKGTTKAPSIGGRTSPDPVKPSTASNGD